MGLGEADAPSPDDLTAGSADGYRVRALLLWPRLDRRRLARTGGDPLRIARLVCRRSSLPIEVIVGMLTGSVDPS